MPYAINSIVVRTLNWPLPAITISEEECTHIISPIIKNILAKLKVVRSIKRTVIYGTIHLQGMGMKNLYTLLGAIHITLLVQLHNSNTDLDMLLQTSLECLVM